MLDCINARGDGVLMYNKVFRGYNLLMADQPSTKSLRRLYGVSLVGFEGTRTVLCSYPEP